MTTQKPWSVFPKELVDDPRAFFARISKEDEIKLIGEKLASFIFSIIKPALEFLSKFLQSENFGTLVFIVSVLYFCNITWRLFLGPLYRLFWRLVFILLGHARQSADRRYYDDEW